MEPVAASGGGGRSGRVGNLETSRTSHGSEDVGGGGDGFLSFRYWSGYHRNLTALKELESRAGGSKDVGSGWATSLIKGEGGVEITGNKIQKIMEAKALQTI